jgi:hypothetical protein
MRIKRLNESLNNLNYETFDFFDLIVEKLKSYKGYTVFSIEKEEQFCKIFNFETEEEFNKNFSISKHPIYPGSMIVPNNVVEIEHGIGDTCIIGEQEFTINPLELYLMKDGKLIR